MCSLSRVVWREGMHLAPQHFQEQSRYLEGLVDFASGALFHEPCGLVDLELDPGAVANGTVAIIRGRGIMPDGLAFDFPQDALPGELSVRDGFSPTRDRELIVLTIPRGDRPGASSLRFDPTPRAVRDEFIPREDDVVEVLTATKRFGLALGSQAPADHETLPVARILRSEGSFVYDPSYVPPCLKIGASQFLMTSLAELVNELDERAAALRLDRRAAQRSRDATDVSLLWLLHAIGTGTAVLRHHLETRWSHPEELFLDLARLAGALSAFTVESDATGLPVYNHQQLDVVFTDLFRRIRGQLDIVRPVRRAAVRFRRTDAHSYVGKIEDPDGLDPTATWYLGLRWVTGSSRAPDQVQGLVKLCSARHLQRVIRESREGMTLVPDPFPPSEIAPQAGWVYFKVSREGRISAGWWQMIVSVNEETPPTEVGRLGVYVPASLGDVELELVTHHSAT